MDILHYPAVVLFKKAEPVIEFGKDLVQLCNELVKTMSFHSGLGLAAPQVGISRRIFILKQKTEGPPIIAVNPQVSPKGEYKVIEEGCLSLPGIHIPICRQDECTLTYQSPLEGNVTTVELRGLDAHCTQHEADHLEGVFFLERTTKHYRKKALKMWEESRQRNL